MFGNKLNKKGFVFTLDAVIGLILVLSTFVFATALFSSKIESPLQNYEQLHFAAHDSMEVMSQIGTLDQVGALWATGNCTLSNDNVYCVNASSLAAAELNKLLPTNMNYQLLFANDTVADLQNTPLANATGVAITTRVASGFTKGRQQTGFVSRAYATRISNRTTTRVYPFHISGAGWKPQLFKTNKSFALPNDSTIFNGTLYLSVRYGSNAKLPPPGLLQELSVNGVSYQIQQSDWDYTQFEPSESTSVAYKALDVTSSLTPGSNLIKISLKSPTSGYASLNPGTYLKVTIQTNQSFVDLGTVNKRFYYDSLDGNNGVWGVLPYYVPKGSTGISATLHLVGEHVYDAANDLQNFGHHDVEIYVNTNSSIFNDSSPAANPVYDLNLTPYTKEGTNTVFSYFDAFDDQAWGQNDVYIKSSSYVEVNYTTPPAVQLGFGEIDVTRNVPFGGDASNPKNLSHFIDPLITPIVESFVDIAEGFNKLANVSAWYNGTDEKVIFTSPASHAIPTTISVPIEQLKNNVTNFVSLKDFQWNNSLSSFDFFLNQSALEYTYFVRINVPYGSVFDNSSAALADARTRLQNLSQQLGINLSNVQISNETIGIGGVPTLWGPERFTLQVWQ